RMALGADRALRIDDGESHVVVGGILVLRPPQSGIEPDGRDLDGERNLDRLRVARAFEIGREPPAPRLSKRTCSYADLAPPHEPVRLQTQVAGAGGVIERK